MSKHKAANEDLGTKTVDTSDEILEYSDSVAEPEEEPEVQNPTIELGGPVVPPEAVIDYDDLTLGNHGPRPTAPPEDETVQGEVEDDSINFHVGNFVVLTGEEFQDLVIERIRELETEKARKYLRLFELRVLKQSDEPEYLEVASQLRGYSHLIAKYIEAHSKHFGG